MSFYLSIIIPAFNESQRLPRAIESLNQFLPEVGRKKILDPTFIEIIVVDDGSSDNTTLVVQTLAQKYSGLELKTARLPHNQGKGAAIRKGISLARGQWILIADADGSTSWESVVSFFEEFSTKPNAVAAYGSRKLPDSVTHGRGGGRNTGAQVLNWFIRKVTGTSIRDTQCGFKLVRTDAAKAFATYGRQNRFSWDIEMLVFLERTQGEVLELPVEWVHRDGSKLRPIRDAIRLMFEVILIQLRAQRSLKKNHS